MLKSLYVHIPFCKQKCLYCDFNSFAGQEKKIEQYMEALSLELNRVCKRYQIKELDTVYLGGGTPSFIDAKYIDRLLDTLKKEHHLLPETEITIEMNPCTVTHEKLEIYQNAGINRVSIGLQTTNDTILREIGRAHTFGEFEQAYQLIREVGFQNVNVDLMFGLPKQTLDDLQKSVNYLVEIQPEHISCYSLILHQPIFKNLPSEEEERQMYYCTKEILQKAGYEHYEISNYSKRGMQSKHNLVYWNQGEYVGIGAGASSYVLNERFMNVEGIDSYIELLKHRQKCSKNARNTKYGG